jgi:hypothetical protein
VAETDPSFKVETWPWRIHFRNLFTAAEPPAVNLNRDFHYIFSSAGIYAAVLKHSQWVFSLAVNGSLDPDCEWMLAGAPTADGVNRLKAHVARHCPPAVGMLNENEYQRFFTRRAFTGQVVRVNRMNLAERIVFLGDAAHAVIPATGEGINSALEDVRVLVESLQGPSNSNPCSGHNSPAPHDPTHPGPGPSSHDPGSTSPSHPGWFHAFNAARLADSRALSDYAAFLVESMRADALERKRRSVGTVLMLIGRKVRLLGPTWNDQSFGRLAEQAERCRAETKSTPHTVAS